MGFRVLSSFGTGSRHHHSPSGGTPSNNHTMSDGDEDEGRDPTTNNDDDMPGLDERSEKFLATTVSDEAG